MVTATIECPDCGYPEAAIVRESAWGNNGGVMRKFQCQNEYCCHEWHAGGQVDDFEREEFIEELEIRTPVDYHKTNQARCIRPNCGGLMAVYCTRRVGPRTVRYFRCTRCGCTGKKAD